MWLSRLFALFILLSASVLAFFLGCATRFKLQIPIERPQIIDEVRPHIEARQNHVLVPEHKQTAAPKSTSSDPACYSALVHPGMITHPNPRRVGILGQDVGMISEVLKHRTIDQVDLYTDDERLTDSISFVDHRIAIHHIDFKNNVAASFQKHSFDIIIMYSGIFGHGTSVDTVYDSLTESGVLALPLGASQNKKYLHLTKELQKVGFTSIHVYEEKHCGAVNQQSVLVAFKSYKTRSNWYRNEAEIQIQMRQRTVKTRSGESPLLAFDASTMLSYQVPSKASEKAYCQENIEGCSDNFGSLPSDSVNAPVSQLEVRKSNVSDMAGRGIFAKKDIPHHSPLAQELSVNNFYVLPSTWKVINAIHKYNKRGNKLFQGLLYYTLGYGYGSQLLGETHWTVDSSILLFSNHGCNGTFNYGHEAVMFSEQSVNLDVIPDGIEVSEADPYSPFQERHIRAFLGTGDYTLRDINAGEEILTNYLAFVDPSTWSEDVLILRSQCAGEKAGEITDYESGGKSYY